MKVKRSNSAEDIENMLTAHFAEFETVEASEDDEDFEADADEDEDSEDVEDEDEILDDVEDDEDSEESDDEDEDEDADDEDSEDDDSDEEDEDVSEDDFADDEESDADEDEDEDFSDEDAEDFADEDEEFSDEDEDEADADEDDFDDIDEVIASGEDIVETLIASGAVAVILPTSSHDFAEVKAAFDSLDAEEVIASDDEDCDDEDEDEDEVDSDEEDFEADADEDDEDFEADADEEDDEDFEADADEDDSDDIDDEEANADEDDDEDFEADADEDDDIEDDEEATAGDEGDDEEEDEVDADEDSEQFHPVVDLETIAEASADDVEFSFHEFGGTSWWNVTVAGIPAARITKDHLNEEVHAFFATDDFARNIKSAVASEGLMPVLNGAQAEFYATAYLQSEATEQIRETVEASMKEDVTERLATMRDDFLECVDMSIAGIDKNFWPAIGNPIKASLFEQMEEAGVDSEVAMEIIEASFAKGGAAHFQAVVAKAVELMDKSQETRDDLRETIGSAGVINHEDDGDDEEETVATASFSQALARNSVHTALTLGDRLSRRGLTKG